MTLPAAFTEALAKEQRNRAVAWLGVPVPLCGALVQLLTPRHILELSFSGNAFFAGKKPLLADVFDLLWRLSPAYRYAAIPKLIDLLRKAQRIGFHPLIVLVRCAYLGSYRSARYYHLLERHVATLDLFAAEAEIQAWLSSQHQDLPAVDKREDEIIKPLRPRVYWMDSIIERFWRDYNSPPAQTIDMPIAALLQVIRQSNIVHGEDVIDPSAAFLTPANRK
ncbi:MAG: hypothetical protein WC378_00920 [Opitutaceae bacterium]|jgi:hypothetical protein